MNTMNAFSTPWLNLGLGITMGYSLEQLPSKRRERLPTEPGPGGPVSTWDSTLSNHHTNNSHSSANNVPSTSLSSMYAGSSSVTTSVTSATGGYSSMGGGGGGCSSPLLSSPIKSPPVPSHPHIHGDIGDDLDPHKSNFTILKFN